MRIELFFNAAQLLEETPFKIAHRDVWRRWLDARIIRAKRGGAIKVGANLTVADVALMKFYFKTWLADHPADERSSLAHWALSDLTRALQAEKMQACR